MPSAPVPISTEARRAVRLFKAELQRQVEARDRFWLSTEANDLAEKWWRAGKTGRQRARQRLEKRLGRAEVVLERWLVWPVLRPRGAVIMPISPRQLTHGEQQDSVVVDYLLAGEAGEDFCFLETGLWTLEIPDHALGRAVQRHFGTCNLRALILEAHRNLLLASPEGVQPDKEFRLRAGPGDFVGTMVYGKTSQRGGQMILFRPRTWMHEDGQEEIVRRKPTLVAAPTKEVSLGDGPCLPYLLRKFEQQSDGNYRVLVRAA